ncbi:heparan-alpha-glucosaminide N-acetyltransferase domain-containing protein [Parafrankia sp. FMc2]|uniref:heparan-alpha-glucosaminide N-acetyltransferase domain-containing protein n=1 Tax=Parafrankia sp. FMc2 TaxID=3233196 RepID=UPI0034D413B8
MDDSSQPGSRRITGVDLARGVALIGMVATHVYPAFTDTESDDPAASPAFTLAAGRSAAAFAVLAGVALVLSTRRRTAAEARLTVFLRALGVGVIGLALAYADSGIAVILVYYALLFVLALPLLRASVPVLVTVAVLAMTAVPAVSQAVRDDLPASDLSSPRFDDLAEPGHLLAKLTVSGVYPALAWLGYLCAGMAVAHADLRSRAVAGRLFAGGLLLAAVASGTSWLLLGPLGGSGELGDPAVISGVGSLPQGWFIDSGLYGTTPTDTAWWLAVDTPHSTTPFDLAHTTGTALALLGLALLVAHVPLTRPVAALGAMTLTFYALHVVAMSTDVLPTDPTRSYVLQILVALAAATLWKATGRRGPAEAAVSILPRAAHLLLHTQRPAVAAGRGT